jgi:hypothetical protein
VTTPEYHAKLEAVAGEIRRHGMKAECRGDGAARFVYATNASRAVELSWDGVGVFIEMFEEPSEVSIRDEQQDTFEFGAEEALSWLAREK